MNPRPALSVSTVWYTADVIGVVLKFSYQSILHFYLIPFLNSCFLFPEYENY
jgi:hypothetical protein